jgi:muramoyltetrapeptide carboxypeptidase LdcA involved in peptidoglycan recycling
MRPIIAHAGTQTVLGYLDLIDVEAIAADPKPILGYRDISLLHLVLYARTVWSGSMPTWPRLDSARRGRQRPGANFRLSHHVA